MDWNAVKIMWKKTLNKALTASTTSTRVTLYVTDPSTSRHVPAVVDDPLYRVETGNYDYRVVLRCRQLARTKFAKARNDVMVKLELLEAKHVQVSLIEKSMINNQDRASTSSIS